MFQIEWFKLVYISIQLTLLSRFLFAKDVEENGNDINTDITGSSYDFLKSPKDWIFGDFTISNKERCSSNHDFKVVMLIHSAPNNFGCRSVYRKYVPKEFRVVFLLGSTSPSNQTQIGLESEIYGDIVQGSFIDSYRNLTRKHVMGLTWAGLYCSTAPLVLKSDDDVVHNYTDLQNYFKSNLPTGERPLIGATLFELFIVGHLMNDSVHREKTSKWYVSMDEYPDETLPEYFHGWTYFTTIDTIKKLLNQIPSTPFFWIDDVYVTGFLRNKCPEIEMYDISLTWNWDETQLSDWISDSENCDWPPLISGADRIPLYDAFDKLQICENHSISNSNQSL